ncbi:MAG: histidine kinase dimerization/phosphoacceptor domain -containing protein [Gemmatimonas sp.]
MLARDLPPTSADEIARLAHQEANHRLANCLQFVAMMLASEERVPDPTARTVLAGARMRIAALARLSRTLTDLDGERIALDSHLGDICNDVADAFFVPSNVQLIVNIDDVSLAPRAARTLGLVLHELLVNALKHGAQGCVEVMCGVTASGTVELCVVNETTAVASADREPGRGTAIVRALLQSCGGVYRFEHRGRQVAQVATLPRD